MDRHTCKLCFRRFSNGRALGGHMRSHAASATAAAAAAAAQKAKLPQDYSPSPSLSPTPSPSPSSCSSASRGELEAAEQVALVRDREAAAAAAAAALAADGEVVAGAEEAKQLAFYGLRENPRKSFRLVDPEFSSTFVAVDYIAAGGGGGGGSSVLLQDWESETESSKPPSLRRRSKRRRRFSRLSPPKPEVSFEPEPVSSISDTTPEEDVARCLMMLSRDVWTTTDSSTVAAKRKKARGGDVAGVEEDDEEEGQRFDGGSEEERAAVVRSRKGGRRRYQCGTCGKVFRSYQALGGHRASHKNARPCAGALPAVGFPAHAHLEIAFKEEREEKYENGDGHIGHQIHDADSEVNAVPPAGSVDRRVHECPVCFRVFGSGQALGGHKRSHLAYSSSTTTNPFLLLPSNAAASSDAAATTTAAGAAGGASPDGSNFTKKFAGESLIDLNLPAPMDEEAEISAVFDAEQ